MSGMKNKDMENQKREEIKAKIAAAIESGNNEDLSVAFAELAETIQNNILTEAKASRDEDMMDMEVMNRRGLNTLTSEEREYYNEVITKAGFEGVEKVLPATVFERVFEDLKENHELLKEIDFVNTTGVTEWISRDGNVESAFWGTLTEEIKKELQSAFKKESTNLNKLSAFVVVSKSMLELGPQWLDRYVREILSESMAMGIEKAIISGDGKNKPIGMMMNLKGAVVDGVYPEKTAKALTDFKPATLGKEIMSPLTNGGKRIVNRVLLVVNPLDYWEKIFGLTTMMTQNGTYVYGVMPIPAKIIQSSAVPRNKMIAGRGKDYFMGVGSNQKIEYSDQYKFLDDERVYVSKQYANGKPKDNDSFMLFDIENLGKDIPKA